MLRKIEIDMLQAIADGATNIELSRRFNYSLSYIESGHLRCPLQRIYTKLGIYKQYNKQTMRCVAVAEGFRKGYIK